MTSLSSVALRSTCSMNPHKSRGIPKAKTLPAFTRDQRDTAHALLATRVAFMMGRKLEEGDWSSVYCQAKGIPERKWSNLNIDVMYQGLGVEHKMLGQPSDVPLEKVCGTRLMHPAATRSIRVPPTTERPNKAMKDVLTQYAKLLEARRTKLKEDAPGKEPDLRTGWLLWQTSLREFLYFEEEAIAPDPSDYFAEWRESGGGARKASKNLWIYEKATGYKKFSVTTSAGAKIQPYFDVPPPSDPNLYYFKVQGEEVKPGFVRIWVQISTERELRAIAGKLDPENLGLIIANVAAEPQDAESAQLARYEEAVPIVVTLESYGLLTATFPKAISDAHIAQLLVDRLRKLKPRS